MGPLELRLAVHPNLAVFFEIGQIAHFNTFFFSVTHGGAFVRGICSFHSRLTQFGVAGALHRSSVVSVCLLDERFWH